MPRKKYKAFTEALEKASAFSYRPVESRMGSYGKVFIHNMKKQGRIIGLMKGSYSFKKNPYLLTIPLPQTSFCFWAPRPAIFKICFSGTSIKIAGTSV